jgi:hypothetical protein
MTASVQCELMLPLTLPTPAAEAGLVKPAEDPLLEVRAAVQMRVLLVHYFAGLLVRLRALQLPDTQCAHMAITLHSCSAHIDPLMPMRCTGCLPTFFVYHTLSLCRYRGLYWLSCLNAHSNHRPSGHTICRSSHRT